MAARSFSVAIPLESGAASRSGEQVQDTPAAHHSRRNVKTVGQSFRLNEINQGDLAIAPYAREDKDGRLDLRVDLTGVPVGKNVYWHCAVWFFVWDCTRPVIFDRFWRALNKAKCIKVDHVARLLA